MDYIYTREIRNRVIENRKIKGITKAEMADALGMCYSFYVRKEKYGTIEYDLLKKIAEILSVDITVLLYGEEISE